MVAVSNFEKAPLTEEVLEKFRSEFFSCPKNVVAQNACSKLDVLDVCTSRQRVQNVSHNFTHKVEMDAKPLTNQKSSGRCWIFACLNVIRLPFMKHYNLEEFQFSQSYLFFWDKIERCNFYLNTVIETARRGEPLDGRLVSFLLVKPNDDGGQWDMLVNLIKRYGVMPKNCFPESVCSEATLRMNTILMSKLREYTRDLRALITSGASDADIRSVIQSQMETIYRIVGICLGIPAKSFTWEYRNKAKEYHCVENVTPLQFYDEYVKPHFNVEEKVCLVTDPRPTSEFNKAYTVDCLGNVVGGRTIIYNNQPVELLMKLVAESIKDNEAVWFGCDVSKRFSTKLGLDDLEIHDYKAVFNTDVVLPMSKAERMMYGESCMTHAMVISAVSIDKETEEPTKWRVENSWGEEINNKGYILMTSDWFKEFVYEVVVDKKHVPQSVMDVFKQEPTVLPAWDPMGTLAKAL
ncbi:hypothetical protein WDU94_010001 [Cyamophila willieti]